MRRTTLRHPEFLNIITVEGEMACGANQEWYRLRWQRMAGCGPTTASAQLRYAAEAWSLPALCPLPRQAMQEPFVDFMETVWRYVTPGFMGLNQPRKYVDGIELYGADEGVKLFAELLETPCGEGRPSLERCAAFIRAGLERDCPVAFLNLHNGEEKRLDKWHWVLVTGLEEDGEQVFCTIADGGKEFPIDLGLWHRTAKDRGGFVSLTLEQKGA